MSAYIVEPAHITTLVSFAILHRVRVWHRGTSTEITTGNATEIGAMLLDQNVRSVAARYEGRVEPEEKNAAAEYRFGGLVTAPRLTAAVTILKACACFDYQACETTDYRDTFAATVIEAIRKAAIQSLPGYDAAPGWGIAELPA